MLYERLLGRTDSNPYASVDGKIMVDPFRGLLFEFALGRLTGAQAQARVGDISTGNDGRPMPLTADEVTEAQALIATINGSNAARLQRAQEIEACFHLAEARVLGYETPSKLRDRLTNLAGWNPDAPRA
jgi:hypothetical protein